MSVRMLAVCDAADCDEEVEFIDGDGAQPVCAENYAADRAHLVIDTSWIGLPVGWRFQDDGSLRCPSHLGATS